MNKMIKAVLPFFLILCFCSAVFAYAFRGGEALLTDETGNPVPPEASSIYEPTDWDLNISEEGGAVLTEEVLKEAGFVTGGVFVLSGRYDETIVVDAGDEITHLILDNADVRTNEGPAIFVRSAAKLVITAKEGTENVLADCAYYAHKERDAAVFSYADLTVNGSGRLSITGFLKDAVYTAGVFKVFDTELGLKAKKNALHADDGMLLKPSSMTAEAEKDGLKTGIHKREDKGNICILGGEVRIVSGNTAIRSGRDLYVSSCHLNLSAVVSDIETTGSRFIEEGCLW